MLEFLRNKKILVVVAHPDDEVLGLGASIHLLINKINCKVKAVILGEGITSRDDSRDTVKRKKELETHRSNIYKATRLIGYDSVKIYNFPDNRFDTIPLLDIVKVVENEKFNFNPEIIFTHHGGDLNIDHQRTFEAVITATRPMSNENSNTIITFETVSGTEWRASSDPRHFIPNLFIQIPYKSLKVKCKAMQAYEYESRPFPHPRSPKALEIRAKMWGITNGVNLAEAFQIIRSIQKYEDR